MSAEQKCPTCGEPMTEVAGYLVCPAGHSEEDHYRAAALARHVKHLPPTAEECARDGHCGCWDIPMMVRKCCNCGSPKP